MSLDRRIGSRLLTAAAVLAATMSCGDVIREGRSPVVLVIDSLTAAPGNKPATTGGTLFSDVLTNVTTPAPCTPTAPCPTVFADNGKVELHIESKNAALTPTSNNQVTITRYHVSYRRADGRNTPGVDVPFGFDGSVTGTVPPTGTATLSFEIVRHVAKEESPLVQLIVNFNVINTTADVSFYGKDLVGNEISVTGSITVEFGNFGDF